MRNLFRIFRIKPKQQVQINYNVPQTADRVRTELSEYRLKNLKELTEKDPLFMRINIDQVDYVTETQRSRKIQDILVIKLRKFLSKTNYFPENIKVIDRPNHHLRVPYFGKTRAKDKMHILSGFLLTAFFSFLFGYLYSRLRYDIYYRRYFYVYFTSVIIGFEVFDSKVKDFFEKINDYIPIDLDESHLQYILLRKTMDRIEERKLKNKLEEILDDPDMVELNKVLKKIR